MFDLASYHLHAQMQLERTQRAAAVVTAEHCTSSKRVLDMVIILHQLFGRSKALRVSPRDGGVHVHLVLQHQTNRTAR